MIQRRLLLAAITSLTLTPDVEARSKAELRAFRNEHPCPSTGRTRGPCPGHQVDHAVPLCEGGRDHRSNMQWLAIEHHREKTRADRLECRRRVGNRSGEPGP